MWVAVYARHKYANRPKFVRRFGQLHRSILNDLNLEPRLKFMKHNHRRNFRERICYQFAIVRIHSLGLLFKTLISSPAAITNVSGHWYYSSCKISFEYTAREILLYGQNR